MSMSRLSMLARRCSMKASPAVAAPLTTSQQRNVNIGWTDTLEKCMAEIKRRDPYQPEFIQAVDEVVESCRPLFQKDEKYIHFLPVVAEPERIIQFKVPWSDDKGHTHINRAFRVQFNQALGPYKGGLRFHPSVNLSIIKFLGFEQIFKNSLTGLQMGGAKGGSDFNPKGKTNAEVQRFCQSFMTELSFHIGPDTDVPAGDIGVGGREIGYMYGEWKRITTRVQGVLTGKGMGWGGSNIRPEATGYGVIYITKMAMADLGTSFQGKRCAVSGSGNVAEFTAEKILDLGGTVLTFSDSNGTIYEPDGFSANQIDLLRNIKAERGRCKDYADQSKTCKYFEGQRPWRVVENVDCAFPSATQNEVDEADAIALVKNGCQFVAEGANMPSLPEAIKVFQENCTLYIPAKASNAGGVAVSGLEMTQNSMRSVWTREEVDGRLYNIMAGIYDSIESTSKEMGAPGDYVLGANIAGYKKVADAMFDTGTPLMSWNANPKGSQAI